MTLPTRFDELTLGHGSHGDRTEGMCAMEAAAWFAGEEHSDHPDCVHPSIAAWMRILNDACVSDAQRNQFAKPLIPMCLDTWFPMQPDGVAADADVKLHELQQKVDDDAMFRPTLSNRWSATVRGDYLARLVEAIKEGCRIAREVTGEPSITVPEDFTVLDGADA